MVKTGKNRKRRFRGVVTLDGPTPEAAARKAEAGAVVVIVHPSGRSSIVPDVHLSIEPLDVLARAGLLTGRQHEAGTAYARLRAAAGVGSPHARSVAAAAVAEHVGGAPVALLTDDERETVAARRFTAWREACAAVLRRPGGPAGYRAMVTVVVCLAAISPRRMPELRLALDSLADHWRMPHHDAERTRRGGGGGG